jgi:DNA-binding CsgD family transcriptional regulator
VAELNAADLEMFDRFRIGAALVAYAQVHRVTDAEARHHGFSLAIQAAADLSGIVFPYLHPLNGHAATSRLRRDLPERDPAGKVQNKYLSPHGDNRHLYFPPGSQPLLADTSVPVVIVEAEKSALALAALAERCGRRMLALATGGCWGWKGKTGFAAGPGPGERDETRGPLPDCCLVTWHSRQTLILFDSNVTLNPKVQQARRALTSYLLELHADVRWIGIPQLQGVNGPDDYLAVAGDQAMLTLLDRGGVRPRMSEDSNLVTLDIEDFLAHLFPAREPILSPWLTRQTLALIYAWRGVGKTYLGLEIAYAVATGGDFLHWHAAQPRKVLYVDGEMPGSLMQRRLATIVMASEKTPTRGMLRIINPDLQPTFMPDLATVSGQAALDKMIEPDTALIIADSISALVRRGGRENEAESWLAAAEWAVWKRSQGHSVLFFHHAGKDGEQRGTSRREDHMDIVISLRRPPNYDPKQGAVFETHWKKGRDIFGQDVEPFVARLTTDTNGKRLWEWKALEVSIAEQVAELIKAGMTDKEIAEELGISRTTAYRHRMKAQAAAKTARRGGSE